MSLADLQLDAKQICCRRLATRYHHKYTVPQLRAAIKDRLGYNPPKSKTKEYYVNVMIEADYTIFRFLDLPAEMRNAVYEQLLTLGNGKARTNILRTSKQVYSEASSILYNDTVYKVDVEIDHRHLWTYIKRQPKTGNLVVGTSDPGSERLCDQDFERMTTALHVARFKTISLTLTFRNGIWLAATNADDERMCNVVSRTMSHHLWPLVNFLTTSKQLQTLEVIVEQIRVRLSDELMSKALWPLALLQDTLSINFVGISAQTVEYLRSEIAKTPTPDPGMNLSVLQAHKNAQVVEDLRRAMAVAEYGDIVPQSQLDQYTLGLSDEILTAVKSSRELFRSTDFADSDKVNAIGKGATVLQDSIEDKSLPTRLLSIIDKFKKSEISEEEPDDGWFHEKIQDAEDKIREWME
ncbi:hypothetical protein HII31_03872 [Pseudocercospora fuligena]|uniref:Uncharacterized protein n=1 Tax=Pseudocercospora fuligena TaxID=685502 RepID=A0A8H6RN02_9PEZI|nr:hypothetical protein HII31_03872 [Pseudocercospora fuligena]